MPHGTLVVTHDWRMRFGKMPGSGNVTEADEKGSSNALLSCWAEIIFDTMQDVLLDFRKGVAAIRERREGNETLN
jgi:hypothetical protein